KAASKPAPPSTSHVSLPSHTGATVFIITSRSDSSVKNGKRMTSPRSKPSITTYIRIPNRMITAQIRVRSTPISVLPQRSRFAFIGSRRQGSRGGACLARAARRGALLRHRRPAANEPQHVNRSGPEDDEVHDDEQNQREAHFERAVRAHRIGRTHHAVHHPGLPPHFRGEPAGQQRNDSSRPHVQGIAPQAARRRVVQHAPPALPGPQHGKPDHQPPQAHHYAKREEHDRYIRALITRELLQPG